MIENKYKSHLVVWKDDEAPVIETFHADTKEEIYRLHEEWMKQNNHSYAHMNLFEYNQGEWTNIEKCCIQQMPDIPEFAVLHFLEKECRKTNGFLEGMVIQTTTGRIVRIALADKGYNDGFITTNFIYDYKGKEFRYRAALVRLSPEDQEMIDDGEFEELKGILSDDLFTPMARWFMNHLEQMLDK